MEKSVCSRSRSLLLSVAASLLFVRSSFAEIVNVNIVALAECKTGSVDGWEVNGVDSYGSTPANIRINATEEYLISPVFPSSIRSISLKVKSSSQAGRRLAVIPKIGDAFSDGNMRECGYSESSSKYDEQELNFDGLEFKQFKIALTAANGSTTGWGISEIKIGLDDYKPQPPTNVSVIKKTDRAFTVQWENDESTISNRVDVYQVVAHPEEFTVKKKWTFDDALFTNSGGNLKDITYDIGILDEYSDLSGTYLYVPTNSSGILQLSNGENRGELIHSGFENYSDLTLMLKVKRYNGSKENDQLYVDYIDSENITNNIEIITLGDEFVNEVVSLAEVPNWARIALNSEGNKTNHRVLIDEMAFISNYVAAYSETNEVRSVMVAGGQTQRRISGLAKNEEYWFSVTAFNEGGYGSSPSEPVKVTTDGKAEGFTITFR